MVRQRILHLLVIFFASVSLEGCAIHARPLPRPSIPQLPEVLDIFYATDRERVAASERKCATGLGDSDPPAYAGKRSHAEQLAFGVYSVRIPLDHRIGHSLPNPSRLRCVAAPNERISLLNGTALSREQFFDGLSSKLKTVEHKEIFVLIHGYDARFDEGLLWTAQLKSDFEFPGIGVLYSWPSLGRGLRYSADEENAEWSVPHLKAFLNELSARCPGVAVHLIAHSLGSRLLLEALNSLAMERTAGAAPVFQEVIFAAPDVDVDEFRKLIGPALHLATRMTLYVSSRDSTLVLSGRIHHAPRAGDSAHDLVILPGLDTVDISGVEQHGSAHTYLFQNRAVLADISRILRDSAPPAERFGLTSTPLPGGILWRMRP
jgi:esterase/lipase superfamily enzyme